MKVMLLGFITLALAGLSPVQAAEPLRAHDFLDGVGVNVHLSYYDGGYKDTAAVIRALAYLGVTHVRDRLPRAKDVPRVKAAYEQALSAGLSFAFITTADIPAAKAILDDIAARFPRGIAAIEGPNEVNNFRFDYQGKTGTEAAIPYQAALFDAVKAHPVLTRVPVYNYTNWPETPGKASHANLHPYPKKGRQPFPTLSREVESQRKIMPGKPVVITEAGYYTLPGPHGWGGVDMQTQAKLILNLLFDAALLGIERTYLYQLLDAYPDPEHKDQEKHFGLFDLDYQPKPVATAIRNVRRLLHDNGPAADTFTPRPVRYEIENLPATAKSLPIQRSDGWTFIVIWDEPDIWDETTHRPILHPPTTISLTLAKAHDTVAVNDPLAGLHAAETFTAAQTVSLALAERPLIVAVSP